MYGVVFFGCVGPRELEDNLCATGMLRYELRNVVDFSVEYYPAALCCVMFCDCSWCQQKLGVNESKIADEPSA